LGYNVYSGRSRGGTLEAPTPPPHPLILGKKEEITEGRKASKASKTMLILLTVCHAFHIFYLILTDFQNFPGPVALVKFQDFPGFPGPVQTLCL